MTSIVAVVGLKREAALVRNAAVQAVASGGDEAALRTRLERLAAGKRLRAVVSVGVGGALAPDLKVGEWVIGADVVCGAERWRADAGLVKALEHGLSSAVTGAIAAGGAIVATAAEKAALHARTGALVVDMESHVAARFAAGRGLPFAALRVVSDAADHALPPAVMVSMKADGGVNLAAVLRSVLKNPRQVPALIRTGREAEVAFRKLKLLGRDDLLGRLGIGDADFGQLPLDMV